MAHHFLAFDLGATSGRSILAVLEEDQLRLKELTRFPNKMLRMGDKYYWNIYALFEELKAGLRAAVAENSKVEAIGIDTWGVDFVYIAKDGSIAGLPRAYRDPYTNGIPEAYFQLIPKEKVYEKTGIQFMNFNSLFQLYAAKKEGASALADAGSVLFMPDALLYLLTGKKICEYTIASTSQMLNPNTKQFEAGLLNLIGIDPAILQTIVMPGEKIGRLTKAIQEECRTEAIPVIAVAGHDTASAVAAVPAENERFAYLSSGTWSLMGIEVKSPIITRQSFAANFTNEGGVEGTTRFLKNITGLWLLEQCRKEWEMEGTVYTYDEITRLSDAAPAFQSFIDPDHPDFANPASMTKAIADYCRETNQKTPQNHAGYIRCIFESLALKYKYVLASLQQMAPFTIEKLHVIGGGSQNKLLNRLTANAIGMPVVAGPAEATAIGNALMQAKGLGIIQSLEEMRAIIRRSIFPETFFPENTSDWENAYQRFLSLIPDMYGNIHNL
ncbi:MAG: rhamnulokinase [Candidatus Symbiothrix sp.]|nr:rhamnulokinase [Candidatus Symbiothrix sp.]